MKISLMCSNKQLGLILVDNITEPFSATTTKQTKYAVRFTQAGRLGAACVEEDQHLTRHTSIVGWMFSEWRECGKALESRVTVQRYKQHARVGIGMGYSQIFESYPTLNPYATFCNSVFGYWYSNMIG